MRAGEMADRIGRKIETDDLETGKSRTLRGDDRFGKLAAHRGRSEDT